MPVPALPIWSCVGALNLITFINYAVARLCRINEGWIASLMVVLPTTLGAIAFILQYLTNDAGLSAKNKEVMLFGAVLGANAYALWVFWNGKGLDVEDVVLMGCLTAYGGAFGGIWMFGTKVESRVEEKEK